MYKCRWKFIFVQFYGNEFKKSKNTNTPSASLTFIFFHMYQVMQIIMNLLAWASGNVSQGYIQYTEWLL